MEIANQEYKEALTQAGQSQPDLLHALNGSLISVEELLRELEHVLAVTLGAESQDQISKAIESVSQ
jgi:hypothetical protein